MFGGPALLIVDRTGRVIEPVEPEPEIIEPAPHERVAWRFGLLWWKHHIGKAFLWRRRVPVEDVCQLKQHSNQPGRREWFGRDHAGNHNYHVQETDDVYGNPVLFALYEDARHVRMLRERAGSWGRNSFLIGATNWCVWKVEIRDHGALWLTVERHECGDDDAAWDAWYAAEADANRIERDRATGLPLPVSGSGARF